MKLTVFAATGGIGRHLFEQALAAGHEVTAVVRTPANLPPHDIDVKVVTADLATPDRTVLMGAVQGADAVLSGLGPRDPKHPAAITSQGTRAIIEAMQAAGTRRLIVVSAAPVATVASPGRPNPPKHDPGDGFFMRHLGARFARSMFREHYEDLAVMEDLVRESGLDWTISRPPMLNDKALTGKYRTAYDQNVRGGFSVSRADVADHLLRMCAQPETIKHVVSLAN